MKKFIITTLAVASFGATSAFANEVFSDYSATTGLSGVNSEAIENLRNCLEADMQIASSKAIRACSKAYKASIPSYEVRSQILTQRGLLQLSAGRFEKAARDFKSASKLNNENEFAFLGEGYAAMMDQDYEAATRLFNDCKTHNEAAPLAIYGLAMTKELTGDVDGAVSYYNEAASMRPDWAAPREELNRVRSAL